MIRESNFQPPWYLRNPHLQTMLARALRRDVSVCYSRERVELPDGDFLDLDWGPHFPNRPITLILHGLEGSSSSHYVCGLVKTLTAQNFNTVVMNFRMQRHTEPAEP